MKPCSHCGKPTSEIYGVANEMPYPACNYVCAVVAAGKVQGWIR